MTSRKRKNNSKSEIQLKITTDSIDKISRPYRRFFEEPPAKNDRLKTGSGRMYGAGGAACDICPDCVGNADWCPFLD